ncbi:MAG: hypothetical protein R3B45_12015 [Bdellovibrionota bacterium]
MERSSTLESNVTYFSEEICSKADDTLRFAYLITLNRDEAHKCVQSTFKTLAAKIADFKDTDNLTKLIVHESWQHLKDKTFTPQTSHIAPNAFNKLSIETRAAIAAIDYLGLSAEDTVEALGMTNSSLRRKLAEGRNQLIKQS